MTHTLNQLGYLLVAEVLVGLATDATVYLSRRGDALKVKKMTVAISLHPKQVPRLFESLYDGVTHKLHQVGCQQVAEVLVGIHQFTSKPAGESLQSQDLRSKLCS